MLKKLVPERIQVWIGQTACNFGLYVLGLGPKDEQDKKDYRELLEIWKGFEARRKKLTTS